MVGTVGKQMLHVKPLPDQRKLEFSAAKKDLPPHAGSCVANY